MQRDKLEGTKLQSRPQTMSYSSSKVVTIQLSKPVNNASTSKQLLHVQFNTPSTAQNAIYRAA